MYHFTIVIGESGHCNLDLLDRLVLEAQVRQQRQSTLHFHRDPISERVGPRIICLSILSLLLLKEILSLLVQPIVKEFRLDVKFDRVVTSCDGFDVPLNVAELLVFADVVEIVDDEESKEDSRTRDQ